MKATHWLQNGYLRVTYCAGITANYLLLTQERRGENFTRREEHAIRGSHGVHAPRTTLRVAAPTFPNTTTSSLSIYTPKIH